MATPEHETEADGGLSAVDRHVGHPSRDEVLEARSIAEHMVAIGGPDFRYMSDVELVAHMMKMAKVMGDAFAKVGISANEATNALHRLAEAMNKVPNACGEPGHD